MPRQVLGNSREPRLLRIFSGECSGRKVTKTHQELHTICRRCRLRRCCLRPRTHARCPPGADASLPIDDDARSYIPDTKLSPTNRQKAQKIGGCSGRKFRSNRRFSQGGGGGAILSRALSLSLSHSLSLSLSHFSLSLSLSLSPQSRKQEAFSFWNCLGML